MDSLAVQLRNARKKKGLMVKDLAQGLNIDAALVSRFETGKRIPTNDQIQRIASILDLKLEKLLSVWMAEKIISEVGYGEIALDALMLAEEQVKYVNQKIKAEIPENLHAILKKTDTLKDKLDKLRKSIHYRVQEADDVEYTYESNKIEGNTLTLQETAMVVADGITISGKSMREHLEAINHYDAITFIRELAGNESVFRESHVLQLHNLVLRGIDRENAGKYRTVPVRITGSTHFPPDPYLVPVKMEELFRWYHENYRILHPVLLAAEMHERLVTIHPFIDGNGRTSRLFMNLILLQHGYVVANIRGRKENRLAYYNALENARIEYDKNSFLLFIAETELSCMESLLSLLLRG